MDKTTFDKIRNKCGKHGSFAYWEGNAKNISFFDRYNIYEKFHDKFIFIALHPSIHKDDGPHYAFKNFHSSDQRKAKDYKLWYAIKKYIKEKIYGSYITDLYKDKYEDSSEKIIITDPITNNKAIKKINEEIKIIGKEVVILALGRKTEKVLRKYYDDRKLIGVKRIVYLTHYSHHYNGCASKKGYANQIKRQLKSEGII